MYLASPVIKGMLVVSLAVTLPTWSVNSFALEFQCEIPNDTRYLRVDIPGEKYLCEVSVTYKESGIREVKWYAENDSLFCSAKAYDLRDKYEALWNYTCTTWPDRDGVDKLSPAQRLILDQRLKALKVQGQAATPTFTITGIRAVASTPLDKQAGMLALQFFTENGDFTEVISDQVDNWSIVTTINQLADHVQSALPINAALLHAVSDEGSLEVYTQLDNENNAECFGSQVLTPVGKNGMVKHRTPHTFVCQGIDPDHTAMDEAAPLLDENLLERQESVQ